MENLQKDMQTQLNINYNIMNTNLGENKETDQNMTKENLLKNKA